MSKNILEIENLAKRFDDGQGGQNTILENVNLSLVKNEFLCILGPSGCGKTTLLRCIAGFETFEGEVRIDGKPETTPNTNRTMVFQDFDQLLPWKTVEKNVQYPLQKQGVKDKAELQKISDKYLATVELSERRCHFPHQLSGGMKQRAAIARALAVKPSIILMDEPFASLDAFTRANLQKELLRIKDQEDMTVIFITHNIQEALILGTRIIAMGKDGGIFKLDEKPQLPKPVSPSTEGYGKYWEMFSRALDR